MTISANDLLMGGGVPAAKFDQPGTSISGRITREPEAREQTDFTTGEVLRWPNGDPKMQVIVHLTTEMRDPASPTDDGTRAVYIKGNMLKAVQAAIRAAGAPGLAVGDTLSVTYTGNGEPTKNFGAFSTVQQTAMRDVLSQFSAVSNLNFVEIAETSTTSGDLRFAESDATGTAWG